MTYRAQSHQYLLILKVKNGDFNDVWGRLFSKYLHIYCKIRRGLTFDVRDIVRTPKGEFLLVRHTYTPGRHFPGGGVEAGQTMEAAQDDELVQEAGLCVSGDV